MSALLLAALLASPAAAAEPTRFHSISVRPRKCVEGKLSHPLGFAVVPGCEETIQGAYGEVKLRFNRLGLRGPDYPPKKKGTARILLMGDSSLVAAALPEEQGLPRQLERELRARGLKAEVINAGTDGYSGVQLAILAPKYLAEYKPDLAVFFPSNSITFLADTVGRRYLSFDDKGRPLAYYRNPVQRLPGFLQGLVMGDPGRISVAITWFEILDQRRACRAALRDPGLLLAATLEMAAHVKRAAAEAGAKFLFLTDTTPVRTNQNSMRLLLEKPMALAQRFLIPEVVVKSPELQAALEKSGLPWAVVPVPADFMFTHTDPSGFHLNQEGNALRARVMAEEILKALRAKGAP